MNAVAYVEAFQERGVLLWREGDSLRVRGSSDVLTDSVLDRLKSAKSKILPILPESPPVVVTDPPDTSSRSPEALAAFRAWAVAESDRLLATPGAVPELDPATVAELQALALTDGEVHAQAVAELVARATPGEAIKLGPGEWIGEHESEGSNLRQPEQCSLLMESPTTAFLRNPQQPMSRRNP